MSRAHEYEHAYINMTLVFPEKSTQVRLVKAYYDKGILQNVDKPLTSRHYLLFRMYETTIMDEFNSYIADKILKKNRDFKMIVYFDATDSLYDMEVSG